ncbi:MAG: PQQ-binding-like beta-propeller repeat protein, partial [Fimbriimonadales bacterium]
HALALATGRTLRTTDLGGNFSASAVVGPHGALVGNTTGLLALVDASGRVRWSVREKEDGAGVYGTPVVWRGLAVVPSRSRRVFAVDLATGRLRWTHLCEGAVEGSPIIVGSTVVVGDDSGWLHLLRASDGKLLWRTRLGGQIKGSASWNGSLLLVGTTEGSLWAFQSGR